MKDLLVTVVAPTLVSCATSNSTTPPTSAAGTGTGSSYTTAIVVPATNEITGVQWEYAYIRSHYPGSKFMYQALDSHGAKPYDLMTFKTADGKQHTLYFDISRYFGRY
jgi:hypothetical protein